MPREPDACLLMPSAAIQRYVALMVRRLMMMNSRRCRADTSASAAIAERRQRYDARMPERDADEARDAAITRGELFTVARDERRDERMPSVTRRAEMVRIDDVITSDVERDMMARARRDMRSQSGEAERAMMPDEALYAPHADDADTMPRRAR